MINFVDVKELLQARIQEHILILRDQLGISCIRMHYLLSDHTDSGDMTDAAATEELDSVTDFLVNHNLNPWIVLDPVFSPDQMDTLFRHWASRYGPERG